MFRFVWNETPTFRVTSYSFFPLVLALLDQSILRIQPSLIPRPHPNRRAFWSQKFHTGDVSVHLYRIWPGALIGWHTKGHKDQIFKVVESSKEHSFLWKIFPSQGVVLFLLAPTVQLHKMQKAIHTIINKEKQTFKHTYVCNPMATWSIK